jgi:hypothetical protein
MKIGIFGSGIVGNTLGTKFSARKNIVDVGDITAARGTEGLMLLWIRLYGKFQTPHFNWHITR